MKLPAQSRITAWDTARSRDRAAVARLQAAGEPFTVPAFCAALVAVLDAEAGPKDQQWEAPWTAKMS
jgi:hypothetical protein